MMEYERKGGKMVYPLGSIDISKCLCKLLESWCRGGKQRRSFVNRCYYVIYNNKNNNNFIYDLNN